MQSQKPGIDPLQPLSSLCKECHKAVFLSVLPHSSPLSAFVRFEVCVEVLEVLCHAAATSMLDITSPSCSSVPLTSDCALACPPRSEMDWCPEAWRRNVSKVS